MSRRSAPDPRGRRRQSTSGLRTFLVFVGVFLWIPITMGLVLYYLWAEVPYRGYPGPRVLVEVPRRSGQEVLRLLQKRGVLRPGPFGRVFLTLSGHASDLKAGEYLFEGPLTAPEVLDRLVRGEVYYHHVTIPEGLRSTEIFEVFLKEGFGTEEDFQRELADTSRIAELDPEATDIEGYLFPDTYSLVRGATARQIVDQMVTHHLRLWTPVWKARARELGLTPREVITLASMIEKETGQGEERPIIASVFHNRLRQGMKLQCDPTVIYALAMRNRYRGVITRSNLAVDSRYNTYVYRGLPPGPIANPGQGALEAALFPEPSDYLYFVSMNNGRHLFSTNLRDHNRAVERFQR